LLDACCTEAGSGALPNASHYFSGDLRGHMLPAGRSVRIYSWAQAPNDPRWARLEAVNAKIGIKVCYCSVFDECYVHDSGRAEPERIAACPVPAVPYVDP
jgi:hypothetical protein